VTPRTFYDVARWASERGYFLDYNGLNKRATKKKSRYFILCRHERLPGHPDSLRMVGFCDTLVRAMALITSDMKKRGHA